MLMLLTPVFFCFKEFYDPKLDRIVPLLPGVPLHGKGDGIRGLFQL